MQEEALRLEEEQKNAEEASKQAQDMVDMMTKELHQLNAKTDKKGAKKKIEEDEIMERGSYHDDLLGDEEEMLSRHSLNDQVGDFNEEEEEYKDKGEEEEGSSINKKSKKIKKEKKEKKHKKDKKKHKKHHHHHKQEEEEDEIIKDDRPEGEEDEEVIRPTRRLQKMRDAIEEEPEVIIEDEPK